MWPNSGPEGKKVTKTKKQSELENTSGKTALNGEVKAPVEVGEESDTVSELPDQGALKKAGRLQPRLSLGGSTKEGGKYCCNCLLVQYPKRCMPFRVAQQLS